MKIEVLISCMHQKNADIIRQTNIQTDAVIINQCDTNKVEIVKFYNHKRQLCRAIIISTTERGLSKSRNMAIAHSNADICLICDDDETLDDDYEDKIRKAYLKYSDAVSIVFKFRGHRDNQYPTKDKKINYITALKVVSFQITFKRNAINDNNIKFDETLGSGVSKAGGEENVFIYDILKRKQNIYRLPIDLGTKHVKQSQWFHGYDEHYIYDQGILVKKLMGKLYGLIYATYFVFKLGIKRKLKTNYIVALREIYRGLLK